MLFIIRDVTITLAPYFAFRTPGTSMMTIPVTAPTAMQTAGNMTGGIFSHMARMEPVMPEMKKMPSPPRLNRLALNIRAMESPEKIRGTAVSTMLPR